MILSEYLQCSSGGGTRCPCPLEVEAAQMSRNIDDLANEEQAWDFAGFHRFRRQFIRVDSASSHFGLLEALRAGRSQEPIVQSALEVCESRIRPGRGRMHFQPAIGQAIGQHLL